MKHSKGNSLKPAAILPDHHCLQLNPNISSRCISEIMHDNSLIKINKEFYENRTRTMTMILWKAEIKCTSSVDHSFLVF